MKYRIKPKPYIEAIIRSSVPRFVKLLCLERPPYITFSQKEIKQLNLRGKSRLGWKYCYGRCWVKKNIIFINPNHTDIETARNTLAHEFIHFRFPYLAHTKVFEQKVKELLEGKQFKPYHPRV